MVFLILYVDDILLIGNDKKSMTMVKEWLASQFQMKIWDRQAMFLGFKLFVIARIDFWLYLRQRTLTRFLSGIACKTPRKVIYHPGMEYTFLRKNVLRLLRGRGYEVLSLCIYCWKFDVHYAMYKTGYLLCYRNCE